MTLPVRCAVTRPSFASITDTLREEFPNKGWQLYETIYIDRFLMRCAVRMWTYVRTWEMMQHKHSDISAMNHYIMKQGSRLCPLFRRFWLVHVAHCDTPTYLHYALQFLLKPSTYIDLCSKVLYNTLYCTGMCPPIRLQNTQQTAHPL